MTDTDRLVTERNGGGYPMTDADVVVVRKNAEWLLAATTFTRDHEPQQRHQEAFARLLAALSRMEDEAEGWQRTAEANVAMVTEYKAEVERLREVLDTIANEVHEGTGLTSDEMRIVALAALTRIQARIEELEKVDEATKDFARRFQMVWAGSTDPAMMLDTEASQSFLRLLAALAPTREEGT